jgi:hypothetical protein
MRPLNGLEPSPATKTADATLLAGILPKLTPAQQRKIEQLSDEERGWFENILSEEKDGEAYFLLYFDSLWEQLEYVRTL